MTLLIYLRNYKKDAAHSAVLAQCLFTKIWTNRNYYCKWSSTTYPSAHNTQQYNTETNTSSL